MSETPLSECETTGCTDCCAGPCFGDAMLLCRQQNAVSLGQLKLILPEEAENDDE